MLSVDDAARVLRANFPWALAVNIPIAAVAYAVGAVRGSGMVVGIVYGVVIYCFGGYPAFLILLFFFLAGSIVSKAGMARKEALDAVEDRRGARGAASVVGKCTAGAVLALLIAMAGGLAVRHGRAEPSGLVLWLALAYVGAFAAALADTCASEMGPLYGDMPLLLTTWEPVVPGTPGGVSVAGTTLGIAGAVMVGLLATILGVVRERAILYLIISSFCASVMESYLRARWPGRGVLAKQLSNVADTLTGAVVSVLLAAALGY